MSQHKTGKKLTLAISAITAAMVSVSALAAPALEEVVVTAQKRAEGLQDVPISMAAVSGDKIADAGITQMEGLASYVPNFTVSKGGTGENIYMRGLGSGQNQGFEQTVGTYVDGVYRGRGVQITGAFLDLARVEVLRGPQGTLFGKNTIAGALNLTSANPSDEFEGTIKVSVTPEFGTKSTEFMVSGPLSETFSARLALKYRDTDGYLDNVMTNNEEPSEESLIGRLTLNWDVSDELTANLKIQRDEFESNGRSRALFVQPSGNVSVSGGPWVPATAVFPNDPSPGEIDTTISVSNPALGEKEFDETWSNYVTLNVEYLLGEHTLNLVTGWQEYKYERANDADLTELPIIFFDQFDEEFEQFSQEVRLTSPGGEFMDYIVGAYYQTSETIVDEIAHVYSIFSPQGLDGVRDYSSESDSWSVFGQFTFNLSDRLRMTAGLRYGEEQKDGTRNLNLVRVSDGAIIPAIPPAGLATHSLKADRKETSVTPSVNVQYDWGDTMLYATASKGFKAGGFDARSNLPVNFEFEEEEVVSGEIGAKMAFDDIAAELNVSVFWMEFKNLQTSVFDGAFGFFVENAGQATSQGIEIDGRWAATESLTVNGSIGYLDFEYDEFAGGKCFISETSTPNNIIPGTGGQACDFGGRDNIFTPEWSASLAIQHYAEVGSNLELKSGIDLLFKDNHYTSNDLNPHTENGAYSKINARIALSDLEGSWEVALVGNNLTDKQTQNFAIDVPFVAGAYAVRIEEPRSWSLQAKYNF